MASNFVVLLTFLITQVLCEQKNSLTFVIDDTASMHDELAQVKYAAKSIVDIVLNEKSSQIEDIVLVTFNDPGTSFRKRTRNAQELKQSLDDIVIHGGGNCPEMSLSGIKQALLESQPGSYLYVFTDATARDYTMFEEIKTLCQEKRSQIFFILTGDCHNSLSLSFQVYHKLAAASNGQVFRISKDEVKQVLTFVKETIKGDGSVLTSQIVPPNTWSYVKFNIDDKTEYAIVSASGSHVILDVIDQHDRKITDYDTITTTKNVKVLKFSNLRPGLYRAKVLGSSDVNVKVFARTDFTFDYGFSDKVENSLKLTETQPTIGKETHLMISVKDPKNSVMAQVVEILDMNEKVIATLPLTKVGELHATAKFVPPNRMFKVAVTATARKTGKTIRRIAKTPVEPIKPVTVAPEITKAEKNIKAKEGSTVDIHCRIRQGKPTPHITWYFKQQGAGKFMLMKDRTDNTLRVADVTAEHTGQYQCVAENSAGRAEHTIQLDVEVSPQFEKTSGPEVITTKEKLPVKIECKLLKGNPPPKVTWYWQPNDPTAKSTVITGTEFITSSHPIVRKYQVSLPSVEHRQAGKYRCVAENSAGTDEMTTQLNVLVAPEISDSEKIIKAKEGSTVDIRCRIRQGKPKPHVTWYFKQQDAGKFMLMKDRTDDTLRVTDVTAKHTGQYQCVAENSAGRAEHTIQLDVEVRPQFEKTSRVITTKEKLPVTIECKLLKGNPPPKVTWYWQPNDPTAKSTVIPGTEFITSSHPIVRSYQVSLPSVEHRQAGKYRCVAENSAGTDEMTIQLNVLVAPEIENNAFSTVNVKENSTKTLQCKLLKGNPKPTARWLYKSPKSDDYVEILKDNEQLRLDNIQLKNAGRYKCEAQNSVGHAERIIELIVEAPPRIVFTPPNKPQYTGVEGDVVMKLPCTAVGFPTPDVTWVVDGSVIGIDKSQTRYVEDGTLVVMKPTSKQSTNNPNKSHTYVCNASNKFGKTHQPYVVQISGFEDYNEVDKKYGVIGLPYTLNCSLPFKNPDSVRWFYNSVSMNKTGPSLHWEHPTQENNGNYTCRVSDMNGAASKTVEVIFGKPPSSSTTSWQMEWSGEPLEISCSVPQIPSGKYEWYYRGKKIKEAFTDALSTDLIGWGQYTCRASNPLGSLNMTYNITTNDCFIDKTLWKTKNMPVILNNEFAWLNSAAQRYLIVQQSDKLNLICQDEPPKTKSKSHLNSNRFTKFPSSRAIVATCDNEDRFLVDGAPHRLSELDCKEGVMPTIVPTGIQCLGENTQMIHVGFYINAFTNVYSSCLDTKRNVPLFTSVNMTGSDSVESDQPKGKCRQVAECCFETAQLVNAADVSFGPAEMATFKASLNSVSYCRPNDNNTSWHDIEKQIRKLDRTTVWSGAFNYTNVDDLLVPQYLWKIVKDLDSEEKVAIVHYNGQAEVPPICEDVCRETTWVEAHGSRTYCCSLKDFATHFDTGLILTDDEKSSTSLTKKF